MRASVQPLIYTSAEWARQTLALFPGEIAWEIAGTQWYMLRGDGESVTGSKGDYTRLRVRADTLTVDVPDFPGECEWLEGKPSASIPTVYKPADQKAGVHYLCRATDNLLVYELPVKATGRAWGLYTGSANTKTTTLQTALEEVKAWYYKTQGVVDGFENRLGGLEDFTGTPATGTDSLQKQITDEAEKRSETDEAITKRIDRIKEKAKKKYGELKAEDERLAELISKETGNRETEDGKLSARITKNADDITQETQNRLAGDAALLELINGTEGGDEGIAARLEKETQDRKTADTELTNAIKDEETARSGADAALSGEVQRLKNDVETNYAPLKSPHFAGMPEVPDPVYDTAGNYWPPEAEAAGGPYYPNPAQAVPLKTHLELFNFTNETAGNLIRRADAAPPAAPGMNEYQRKLDVEEGGVVLREVDHALYASQPDLDDLRGIVMSSFGDGLRKWDTGSGADDFRRARFLDIAPGGTPEFRRLDLEPPLTADIEWVELAGAEAGPPCGCKCNTDLEWADA